MSPLLPLPRLRSPTFNHPPPPALSLISLSYENSVEACRECTILVSVSIIADRHSVKPAANSDSEDLNSDLHSDLAYALWYALWDVYGSTSFRDHSELPFRFQFSSPGLLQPTLRQLGLELSSDSEPISVSRAWWYERYSIFSYPHLAHPADDRGPIIGLDPAPDLTSSNSNSLLPSRSVQVVLPRAPATLYERYISHLDSYLCLSIFGDTEHDVDLLHSWHNQPRVDRFWRDAGNREFHVDWLKARYNDPHVLPILGSYRGSAGGDPNTAIEPFAYYEIYWASDDRIAKFYEIDPYDRGIHMLVGSTNHRGPHRVRSWLPSLAHYIFSDDQRTNRILCEPDHQNLKMIQYLEGVGFQKIKDVDMGHKIATILVLERSKFWERCPL